MTRIIIFLFLMLPLNAGAQMLGGNANQTPIFAGGIQVDKELSIPLDTAIANLVFAAKPSMRKQGSIVFQQGIIYLHSGTAWQPYTQIGTIVTGQGGTNKYYRVIVGGTTYYLPAFTTLPN